MPSSSRGLRAALALFGRAMAAGRRQQQQAQHQTAAAAAAVSALVHAPPPRPPATLLGGGARALPLFCRSFASSEAASSAPASEKPPTPAPKEKEDSSHLPAFTMAEVALRDGISGGGGGEDGNGRAPAWLAIDGLVYDATPYLDEHPGGSDPIVLNAGTDASAEFAATHTPAAREVLRRFVIGRLAVAEEEKGNGAASAVAAAAEAEAAEASAAAAGAVALDPKRRVPLRLASRRWVSPTSVLLKFALPGGKAQRAGLPTGQHVMVYFRDPSPAAAAGEEGELVARAYTPVSRDDESGGGSLDLLVRVYRPSERFPRGGRLSQLLADAVAVEGEGEDDAGEPFSSSSSSSSNQQTRPQITLRVEFKGPVGHFRYLGQGGQFSLANAPARRASRLLLVAGGSGITPCYQVIRAALEEREKVGVEKGGGAPEAVALVYGSPAPEEILLKQELDDLARRFPPPAFRLHYTVDRVPGGPEAEAAWRQQGGGVGFVTREALERFGFPGRAEEGGEEEGGERLALVCGPPLMLEKAVVPALKAMGYEGDRLVAF